MARFALIIRRLIEVVVLKIILDKLCKILSTILLLLNCTGSFHLKRKHIECVEAE